jgi:hypothetical protein
MEFTFGIITNGMNDDFLNRIIQSIVNNNIPIYEIIIVGNTKINCNDTINIIKFNENYKKNWITKKKNLIAMNAKYDNIVMLHDYIELENDWYEGFIKYGNNFDWCITKIKNNNGSRFRDYTLFPYNVDFSEIKYSPTIIDTYFANHCLLPYNFVNTIKTNKYMYISGSYYVIKKNIATKYLLDEKLVWGQSEDVEYSKRLHENGIIIKCNPHSSVTLLKYKESIHWEKEITPFYLNQFINYCNNN